MTKGMGVTPSVDTGLGMQRNLRVLKKEWSCEQLGDQLPRKVSEDVGGKWRDEGTDWRSGPRLVVTKVRGQLEGRGQKVEYWNFRFLKCVKFRS